MLTLEGPPGPVAALASRPTARPWPVAARPTGSTSGSRRRDAGVLAGHAGGIRALAFSPDGHYLASGGADGKVQRLGRTHAAPVWVVAAPEPLPDPAVTFVGPGMVLFGIGKRAEAVARPATLFLLDLSTRQTAAVSVRGRQRHPSPGRAARSPRRRLGHRRQVTSASRK